MAHDAILYLCRKGDPSLAAKAFFSSLSAHNAGADGDLVVVLKGFTDGETDPNLVAYRDRAGRLVHEIRMPDEGRWAINAFYEAAHQLVHDRILFLTSHSRILADNWLSAYLEAFKCHSDCGIVGASGAYEEIPGSPFPNINIRTNAFMMDRKLFLDIDPGPLDTKRAGNRFEAGPNSLTRQIICRGMEPIVVDRFGKTWRKEDWPASLTFRSGRQQGLLIADNRTYDYDVSRNAKRRRLAALAFGDRAVVTNLSMAERLSSALRWRRPGAA